ncbi:protein-tyrosine phosphatase [Williamsia muralis]|uniref:Protein-tyrosine phosphatase n=1 Tax=Williamsia marianensis TaxID=85044 RepID=A0A495JYX5_WILMA|nr:low molecular weight phosphatase family protein [Williamsia muralis]RKR94197.1 protein-tyrosine phosphatase [Williamsia muralis]
MKILFVCTGNICRSPVAEKLLERYNMELGLGLHVSSAGTRALNGQPMHPESERVLDGLGIETGDFESRMLTPDIAADCDLLLGMTREHRAVARQLAPARWKRMFALRELPIEPMRDAQSIRPAIDPTDPKLDIRDPIGRPAHVFDEVASDIASSIDSLVKWLEKQEAYPTGKHHLTR